MIIVKLQTLSLFALFLVPALSNPLSPRYLAKRTLPTIDTAWNSQQNTQLIDGFHDAVKLASYAVNAINGPIFTKYFNAGDRDTVRKVFLAIMGNPSDPANPDPAGSSMLGGITVKKDFPDSDGDLSCDDNETMAELRDFDKPNPTLVMCGGSFGHGGVQKGYTNVAAVNCAYIGDRVTWKMDTMGSILLHEYTHMTKLVAPPLKKETDDEDGGYGPRGTRKLDKNKATNNADSYSWFANEALWSTICSKQYADPQPGDDNDPHCGNNVCQDHHTSPAKLRMGEGKYENIVEFIVQS